MSSLYAKSSCDALTKRHVVFIIYDNIVLLDLSGPLQVFSHAAHEPHSGPAYCPHVLSFSGGPVRTNTLVQVDSAPMADWLDARHAPQIDTLVIVGGDGAEPATRDGTFVDQVRQLACRSRRVCSVCSGAFVLAAAGLLEGRRAVTHWEDCAALAAAYPSVQVEVDPIYIKDGPVWTSAGITAGIDMALAIVEEDLGKPAAIAMARSLVTPMVRTGGQSQFSPELARQARDAAGRFTDLHEWIQAHLAQHISVEDMARNCAMSPRNFSRRYTEVMTVPPAKALEAIRVNAARDLLESSQDSVKTIAANCGFQDDERMRRAFLRQINTSPSQYRQQFQAR